jgi:ABC-type Mn2+/Zn2+ transport system permease subunit
MNFNLQQGRQQKIRGQEARTDFSFKREVFFIVAGGIVGALIMAISMTFLSPGRSFGYDLTWIVFGHIVGVHQPILSTVIAGIMIHMNFNWHSIRNISL